MLEVYGVFSAPCRGADGNTPLKQCQNGGFVLHTCNCHCPDGLSGDLCQSVSTDPGNFVLTNAVDLNIGVMQLNIHY